MPEPGSEPVTPVRRGGDADRYTTYWILIALIIVIAIVLLVWIVFLCRRYHRGRQRNRRPTKAPLPGDNTRSAERAENEEFLKSLHTDAEENMYANVASPQKTSKEQIYENVPPRFNERISNRPNGSQSSDLNPVLSQSHHEVSVIGTYSTCENTNTLGTTNHKNLRDPVTHTEQYHLKVTAPIQNTPNVPTSHTVSSKTNLGVTSKSGIKTIHGPVAKGCNNMSAALQNKSTEFASGHNNILKISWDFQPDKNTSSVDPESLQGAGRWRSRANSLPNKVIIDKNKLTPSLSHKITLELSTGSNPDKLYDVPRRTALSSDHKRRFKSANNEAIWNQSDEISSKYVVYENVIIRAD